MPDASLSDCTFAPLTPERWHDLEALFGPRGACAGCWCMWWRLPRSQWGAQKGEGNRAAFEALVASDAQPGILAYVEGRPAGWCAVEPREAYPALDRSRTLKRVDEAPVWSVTCFFVARPYRRHGLTVWLLVAAAEHARARGARILEGYPVEPRVGRTADAWAFTGTLSAFRRAGFVEVARRSATRPIVRRALSS